MVGHLASLSEKRLILSFAPSTPYYLILKRIGEFFPKGSKVITLARQQTGVSKDNRLFISSARGQTNMHAFRQGYLSGQDSEWMPLVDVYSSAGLDSVLECCTYIHWGV